MHYIYIKHVKMSQVSKLSQVSKQGAMDTQDYN